MTKQEQIEEMADIMNGCWKTRSAAAKLYNAGYRKGPDGAVIIPAEERDEEMKEYNEERAELEKEIERLKAENEKRLSCDFVKTAQMKAVKEFAEKLKSKKFDEDMFNDFAGATYVVLVRDIDELLKEYDR